MATDHHESPMDSSKEQYFMSSNEELRRLRMNHEVYKLAMSNRLVLAPLDFPSTTSLKILDSATADGTWLRDFAASLPDEIRKDATFIGTDIMGSYLPKSNVDSNPDSTEHIPTFNYFVQDINHSWPASHHNTLNLLHQRLGLAGATPGSGSQVIRNLVQLIKPGGYIQLVESEMTIDDDDGPAMREFLSVIKAVFQTVGVNPMFAREEMRGWVENAGVVDVNEVVLDCFFGKKVGKMGGDAKLVEESAWSMEVATRSLIGMVKSFPKLPERVDANGLDTLVDRLGKEMREQGANFPLRVTWGRKRT